MLGFTPRAMERGDCQEYHSLQWTLAHPMSPNVFSTPWRAPVTEQRPPHGGPTALLALAPPSLSPPQLPRSRWGAMGQEAWHRLLMWTLTLLVV